MLLLVNVETYILAVVLKKYRSQRADLMKWVGDWVLDEMGEDKKDTKRKCEELCCKGVQIIETVDENEKGGRIKRDFLKT